MQINLLNKAVQCFWEWQILITILVEAQRGWKVDLWHFHFTNEGAKAGHVIKNVSLHGKRDRTKVPFSREIVKDSMTIAKPY